MKSLGLGTVMIFTILLFGACDISMGSLGDWEFDALSGNVYVADSQTALSGVVVSIEQRKTTTGPGGYYFFSLSSTDAIKVTAELKGYLTYSKSLRPTKGGNANDIYLTPSQ